MEEISVREGKAEALWNIEGTIFQKEKKGIEFRRMLSTYRPKI